MSIWLIEVFANDSLNRLFWWTTALPGFFWLLMILFPQARFTREVCRLWLAPPLLGIIYLYIFYLAYTMTGLPNLKNVEMKSVRSFWGHPILFVALWMHRLIMDLFVGIWIYRFGRFRGMSVRIEILLVWISGPLGVLVFGIRYWITAAIRKVRSK